MALLQRAPERAVEEVAAVQVAARCRSTCISPPLQGCDRGLAVDAAQVVHGQVQGLLGLEVQAVQVFGRRALQVRARRRTPGAGACRRGTGTSWPRIRPRGRRAAARADRAEGLQRFVLLVGARAIRAAPPAGWRAGVERRRASSCACAPAQRQRRRDHGAAAIASHRCSSVLLRPSCDAPTTAATGVTRCAADAAACRVQR